MNKGLSRFDVAEIIERVEWIKVRFRGLPSSDAFLILAGLHALDTVAELAFAFESLEAARVDQAEQARRWQQEVANGVLP